VRVNGALIAVSHDQTFLEAIGVERGDHSLTKHSAVKVSFGSWLCKNVLAEA
jgi:ATPase subunit of ABC transporter with duplicated ATPase domains